MNTRREVSSAEKIRIVLDRLRGEYSIPELYRREGTDANYSIGLTSQNETQSRLKTLYTLITPGLPAIEESVPCSTDVLLIFDHYPS